MKNTKLLVACALTAAIVTTSSYAVSSEASAIAANHFTQSVSIDNVLHNAALPPANLTESAIEVNYMINSTSCWIHTIDYQDDYTIHAGPTQGCKTPITQVIVTVKPVNGSTLPTYSTYTINIDPTKYATQAMVIQDQPPTFDSQSGLVKTSGTITAKQQAQLLSE
jgi:hypothetical protein